MSRQRRAMIVVGIAASAVFVYLAMRGLDLGAVRHAFSEAELMPWLPIGIASYLVSHVLRGVRLRVLVRRHIRLGLVAATNVVVVGYGANNVLPARLGELVRAGMLAERADMPLAQSLGVTFIERVLDGLALLLFLVVASMSVVVAGWMHELVLIALVVFGIATAVMVAAALYPRLVIAIAAAVGRLLGPRWEGKLARLATQVTDAGACLRDPRDAFLLASLSIVVWALESVNYITVMAVFGIPFSAEYAVITMAVTGFGLLLPSSPGGIGPYHYFASQAMMVHGVAAPTALAYATLVHLSWFVPNVIWGAAVMLWYGVELGGVTRAATDSSATPDIPPSPAAHTPSGSPS